VTIGKYRRHNQLLLSARLKRSFTGKNLDAGHHQI
jgi:hypothetical protein